MAGYKLARDDIGVMESSWSKFGNVEQADFKVFTVALSP